MGYEIKLPTEWEWQQAATGGDPSNEYPWGPDWDGNRANTYESGLKRSTTVGLYPHGASRVGALDMSGNVWELCLNEFKNPNRLGLRSAVPRAVRGGSWFNYLDVARAAYRLDLDPVGRFDFVGFRCVCASPIL
jgi:formylglycine-generating enzyme required for sulfatase activity